MFTQRTHLSRIAYRDGYDPRMKFHAAFVTFFDGEGQRIVTRMPSRTSGQRFGKSLDGRRINQVAPKTSLKEYRVDVGLLKAIQNRA